MAAIRLNWLFVIVTSQLALSQLQELQQQQLILPVPPPTPSNEPADCWRQRAGRELARGHHHHRRQQHHLHGRAQFVPNQQHYLYHNLHLEPHLQSARRRHYGRTDELSATGNDSQAARRSPSAGLKYKRQALADLAVNRLHILESLDDQLRDFADGRSRAEIAGETGAETSQSGGLLIAPPSARVCLLPLDLAEEPHLAEPHLEPEPLPSCLAGELQRQVPPYMLNLQRQLLGEARTLAQAVRLMPYGSLVMRSFRQPALTSRRDDEQDLDPDERWSSGGLARGTEGLHQELVVELSALGAQPSLNELSEHYRDGRDPRQPQADRLDSYLEETPLSTARPQEPQAACALAEGQLCYWFRISPQLRGKINGSLVRSRESSSWRRERLVEAELHLFKLLPELLLRSTKGAAHAPGSLNELNGRSTGSVAPAPSRHPQQRLRWLHPNSPSGQLMSAGAQTKQTLQRQQQKLNQQHQRPFNRSSSSPSSAAYHLKTNLLEVSLYQILPRKSSPTQQRRQSANSETEGADFPLRLLDIRRIDLYSSGWETFYVKRAVEDWVRDGELNLGLLIKAKSMFDEPIRIGLIRFADLRSHKAPGRLKPGRRPPARAGRQDWLEEEGDDVGAATMGARSRKVQPVQTDNSKDNLNFDSIHQPILVIYTSTAD